MSWIAEAWPWLAAMGILILLSAFFSGSEAALFSLTYRGRRSLTRTGIAGRIASGLLVEPERLLSAILFWNLLINMTYFAIAAIIGGKLEGGQLDIEPSSRRSMAVAFTVASLLTIIFFSEMLPKSLAVLAPTRVSLIVAAPLSVAVRIVRPALPVMTMTNLAVSRLIWPGFKPEPEIQLADIERAIELGTDDAQLQQRERWAFQGLVELAEARVSEVMRQRSKLWMCKDPTDRGIFARGLPPSGYLMVTDPSGEMIVKAIGVRMLRPSQVDDLDEACEPVIYVPWSARVAQVLDRLKQEGRSVAVVVNEFGEMLGAVSIDHILRRALAPRHDDNSVGETLIREVSADEYLVSGSASFRGLAKRLRVDMSGEGVSTVAGFIQRYNERLPRTGDSAPLGRYRLTVIEQDDDEIWISVVPHGEDSSSDGGERSAGSGDSS